ncbi:hypothetical protein, partial [Bacillus cereus]
STKQVKKLAIMPLALTALLGASTIFSTETASADAYTYYNNGTPSYAVSNINPNYNYTNYTNPNYNYTKYNYTNYTNPNYNYTKYNYTNYTNPNYNFKW